MIDGFARAIWVVLEGWVLSRVAEAKGHWPHPGGAGRGVEVGSIGS